ncbi:MAG TPA: kelch repeat-containing protein [Thermoanaerobaculia bacterium]|nr:kelch repeat-containing protein [Thermoanaerobaculia bacterium]
METQRSPGRRSRSCAFRLLAVLAGGALCGIAGPGSAQQDPWKVLAPLPTPRRLLTAAAEGEKIYTFGGCGSPCFDPVVHPSTFEETLLEVYDPETKAWSRKNPIPAILFGAAAVAPDNDRIYVFGGFVTGNAALEYDPEADTWTPLPPMPTPRHGLAAVALNGDLYVIGGSNGSAPSNALEVYGPDTGSWSPKAPMPTARVFLGAAAVGGKIYAIGGSPDCCGNGRTDAVEIYDPSTDSWSLGAPLPLALQVSAVAAAANGKIYVFGGFAPGSGAQSFTLEYDPTKEAKDAWTFKEPLPVPRDQAPAVAIENDIHVLGGSVDCHCRALGDHHSYNAPANPDTNPVPSISKNDGRRMVAPGDAPVYRINVRNKASVALPVLVTDRLTASGLLDVKWCCDASGSECTPSTAGDLEARLTLPPNGVALCRATGTVPDVLPSNCRISNTACVTPPGPPAGCASDLDRITPPDLGLTLVSDSTEGCEYSYTIVVTNQGESAAHDVVLQIRSDKFVLLSTSVPCEGSTCTLSEIAPRSEVRVTATFGWRSGFVCPDVGTVTASIQSPCSLNPFLASAETRAACDLAITKTDDRTTASPGDPIDYTITVENRGCLSVANAKVTDVFPGELGGSVKWCGGNQEPEDCTPVHAGNLEDLLRLSIGGKETYRASGTIKNPLATDKLINTASVKPPVGDEKTATDETRILPIGPVACVAVSCEEIPGIAVEGGTIIKTFVVRNCGQEALADGAGPEFEDALPPELTLVSATASSGTVTTSANTVTWDGSISPGEMVTLEITAMIAAGTLGTTICNQAAVSFEGEGVHDQAACCFSVLPELPIPALSEPGLYILAFLLALLALAHLRHSARQARP